MRKREPDSASLNPFTRAAILPERAKPDTGRQATSARSGRALRGGWGRRASTDLSGTWETCPGGGHDSVRRDRLRESITAVGPGQESEGVRGATKRGNARGAKGPYRIHALVRGRGGQGQR